MTFTKDVTLTITRREYNALCNLLQILRLLAGRLQGDGPQYMALLDSAGDKLVRAGRTPDTEEVKDAGTVTQGG